MKPKNTVKVNFTVRTINSDGSFFLEVDYDDFECITNINYPLFSREFRPRNGWTLDDVMEKIIVEVGDFYDLVEELAGVNETRFLE